MIDLILTNARAHVLNPGFDLVDSLAVGGGRIVAAGRANDIVPLGGAETRTIDMNGKTVLPGFHDAHCHVLARGLMCDQVDLSSSASIGAIKAALRDRAARNPFAPAVLGYGYSQDRLEERRHPEIDDLDSLAPGVPILLRHASGHAVTVNSRLLEMARIVSSTPDPAGGTIVRNSAGRPTGVLLENAAALAYAALPEPTTPERVLALARASSELHALGITSAVDALTLSAEMSAYRLAAEERRLTVRCTLTTDIREILNGEDCAHPDDSRCDDGDFVRVGGTKIFADGAIGTRTAALREPYADNAENKGNALYEQAELSRRIWCAHAAGWQVLAHAIGDRAIDMCLEAFDAAQGAWPRPNSRHRLEHAALLWDDHIVKMTKLGLLAVYQPEFLTRFGDIYREALGPVLGGRIMPFQSTCQEGIPLVFSSDLPVVPGAPLDGIRAATERRSASGKRLDPSECVDTYDALRAYTAGPAYASFLEEDRGTLEAGKRADLVVLSADPTELPPDEWADAVRVLATVVGGEPVYGSLAG